MKFKQFTTTNPNLIKIKKKTMFTLSEWLVAVLTIFIGIYYLVNRKLNFFKDRGVNYIKPLPIVGNMLDVMRSKRNLPEIMQGLSDKFPKSR